MYIGWICYAEKTQGDAILPYISHVRSPQQIMGVLIKHRFGATLNIGCVWVYYMSCAMFKLSQCDIHNLRILCGTLRKIICVFI